jgi:hypothetical protein
MGRPRKCPQADLYTAPRGWQLFHNADEQSDGWEYLLYTDSSLCGTGEAAVGPFTFFLTGAGSGPQPTGQLSLRIPHTYPKPEPTSVEFPALAVKRRKLWLGLGPDEEIAALLSLTLGVRLRSGGSIRRFRHDGDPAGEPHLFKHHAPGLVPVRRRVLPGLPGGPCPIGPALEFLERYPCLQPMEAFVLTKAASQFADALWIADSDPEQAWLRLVTALEVVAVYVQTEKIDALTVFEGAYPKAAERIRTLEGGAAALPQIAEEFEGLLSAGQRFRAFAARYRPDPPPTRPNQEWQVSWGELDDAIKKIYDYRSELLHQGTRLPPMMLDAVVDRDGNGLAECPDNTATYVEGGAAWPSGELPMHLWLFADIVRRTLLTWCTESLASAR